MLAGNTTFYQAKRGVVQDGLVLNIDAGVRTSVSGTGIMNLAGNGSGVMINGAFVNQRSGVLSFDGVNDYVTTTNIGVSGDFSGTISIWTQQFQLNNGWRCCCSIGSTSSGNGLGLFPTSSGQIVIAFFGLQNIISNSGIISPNNWYNLTFVKSSGSVSSSNSFLYINGVNVNLNFYTSITPNLINSIGYIGSDQANEYSNPMIATSFLFYNRALSSGEVYQNFQATRYRFGV